MTERRRTSSAAIVAIIVGSIAVILLALTAFMGVAMGGWMMNGCGGMGGGMGGCHGSRGGAAQTPAALAGDQVTIEIEDFDFSPRDATVSAGATVTWTNKDSAPHDATDDDDEWKTDTLRKGDSGSVTFAEPGVYEYHCSIHPYMKATLRVE